MATDAPTRPPDARLRDLEHALRNLASTADAVCLLYDRVPTPVLLPQLDRLCDQTREVILAVNPHAFGVAPAPHRSPPAPTR